MKGAPLQLVLFSFGLLSSSKSWSETKIYMSAFCCTHNIHLEATTTSFAGSFPTRLLHHMDSPRALERTYFNKHLTKLKVAPKLA